MIDVVRTLNKRPYLQILDEGRTIIDSMERPLADGITTGHSPTKVLKSLCFEQSNDKRSLKSVAEIKRLQYAGSACSIWRVSGLFRSNVVQSGTAHKLLKNIGNWYFKHSAILGSRSQCLEEGIVRRLHAHDGAEQRLRLRTRE